MKSQKHELNLVKYIATREGVEYNSNSNGITVDVTKKQKDLINEVVSKYTFLQELEEYTNYSENKTIENASRFLTDAFSLIDDQSVSKEIYLKYISERPRVEKMNNHGLFNSGGEADLKKEMENIKGHTGPIWTHIISIKRNDARKLGYDNLNQWQLLLKTKIPKIADSMNIELKNLVWNAAFHNEGDHPHVHLVMYSKDPKQGYLKSEGIGEIKSILLNELFKEELLVLKKGKSLERDELKTEFEKELDNVYENIVSKNYSVDVNLLNQFIELSKILPDKGKNVYGYQDQQVKQKVNKIVEEILKNKNLEVLYNKYLDYKREMASYYSGKEVDEKPITKDAEFRKLQNMVLAVVKKVDGYKIELVEKPSVNKEKFNKLNDSLKNIEALYKKDEGSSFTDDVKNTKQENIELEKKELLETGEKLIANININANQYMGKIKINYDFKKEMILLNDADKFNFDSMKEEHLKNIFNYVLTVNGVKKDYLKYMNICKDYSHLAGEDIVKVSREGLNNIYNNILDFTKENIKVEKNILTKGEILENEMKRIEKVYGKEEVSDKNSLGYKGTREKNILEEHDEILERREEFLSKVENKFLLLVDKYSDSNLEFNKVINTLITMKEGRIGNFAEESGYIKNQVSKALNIVLNDPEMKNDYKGYLDACNDFNYLLDIKDSGEAFREIEHGLNDMANEIISVANVNIEKLIAGQDTIFKNMHDSLSKIEDKFMPALDNCVENNKDFKNELSSIFKNKNERLKPFDEEEGFVKRHIATALNIVLTDPSLKEHYEEYINACHDFGYVRIDQQEEIEAGMSGFLNEIISEANNIFDGLPRVIAAEKDIFNIPIRGAVIEGAEKLKGKYNLNQSVDVKYKDYEKGDQDNMKYIVKNVVYDIADILFFSANDETFKKDARLRLDSKINRAKKKQEYENGITR